MHFAVTGYELAGRNICKLRGHTRTVEDLHNDEVNGVSEMHVNNFNDIGQFGQQKTWQENKPNQE